MSVGDVKIVATQRQTLRTVADWNTFRQTHADSLDLFISLRIDHGYAVVIRIRDVQTCARRVQTHHRGMSTDCDARYSLSRPNDCDRAFIPASHISFDGP